MLKWLEQYFVFTRSERHAVVLLVLLSLAVFIIPRAYSFFSKPPVNDNAAAKKEIESYLSTYNNPDNPNEDNGTADSLSNSHTALRPQKPGNTIKYFYFDPNLIGVKEWVQLGLSEKQAQSIEKYKAKGGVFRQAEDLKKMYVLKEKDYAPLIPYVKFVSGTAQERLSAERRPVNINTADSALLTTVKGIGPVFARRIIEYRRQNGNYTALEQLLKVKGITPEVFENIKVQLSAAH